MRKLILLAVMAVIAGCGDPNYVEPAQEEKQLEGRPIPMADPAIAPPLSPK